MTAHDVYLTDTLKSANVLYKEPAGAAAPQSGPYRSLLKRALDITLILLSAPVILPVILALALIVALNGGKPFYAQQRIGKNGRIFRMWKLRSMVCDAEEELQSHLDADPDMRAEWDRNQKLLNDPRVTPIGRFLRKTSIDELPQLFNVLRGDMSLVGPRPMMVEQQLLYPGRDYYDLRPGITGLWQISDRHRTSFKERAFYDTRYNARVSLMTDVRILWSTVRVVLSGTGC
ncbi:sugar transferase [uncultured Tateyamaria sp.]|uniref:sugar transferase n=1 Tax=uncultured Tateyamaria sp. TaxID=455651 RepID=UPI00262F31BF|nr:sugar transferase [uncultured Tateyamaria sp.]